MSDFFQDAPVVEDLYGASKWLRPWLRWKLPADVFASVDADLSRFGPACGRALAPLAREAERDAPSLAADAWGRPAPSLRQSAAWFALKDAAAREGLVALAYERPLGAASRLHQFAKLFLFHPSSAFFSCPVAMTDGAAKILRAFGAAPEHRDALAHLTSRDPALFWTSGQWMTERAGGSDVGGTATQARLVDGRATLHGVKYFASAAESPIALALARLPDAPAGSRGLTLFMAMPRTTDGAWQGVRILRLKDKLGTRALATAELELDGCPAVQIGAAGDGVRTVATMLNITRLHNSICAVGESAAALALLEDYSRRRVAFGKPLAAHPLHRRLLAQLHCLHLAGLLLTLELADLLGREEAGEASDVDRIVLRVMIPVCKIETAKAAVRIASEVVEGFGGAGYIEDVGIARRLRDAQVFSIWEGPSNVLALDMLRALRGGQGLAAIVGDCRARCSVEAPGLERARQRMRLHIDALSAKGQALLEAGEAQARDLAGHLAALYGAALAYSWAAGDERNRAALAPFVDALADLVPPLGAENAVNWAALEEAGAYSPATTSSSGKSSTVS